MGRKRNYSKYRSKGTKTPDGYFDSKGELRRWEELKLLEKAGEITDLERQVRFPLIVKGRQIGLYVMDFVYYEYESPTPIAEEYKGFWTPEAKQKARHFKAQYKEQYDYRVTGTPLPKSKWE